MKHIQSEVLNLTEEMVNRLILKTENAIRELSELAQSKLEPLKEAADFYFPLKLEMDGITDQVEKEKQTLAALIGFRDNKNERKNIRVYKSISNTDPSVKKKRGKRFPFTAGAIEVLRTEQKFLSPEMLVQKVFDRYPEWKIIFQNGRERAEKTKLKNNYITIARGIHGIKKLKIKIYEEKIGLAEWMNGSTPLPKYLPSFMQATEHI